MKGHFSKALFITGFSDNLTHGELVTRFEEYGRITSTRQSEPGATHEYPFAFVEYAISKDATAARSKLHHSVVRGQKLEVHFDTKIPPQFHPMLNDASESMSPDTRRSTSGGMHNTGSDCSALTSPASTEFRSGPAPERQPYAPRYAGSPTRGPRTHHENRRYPDRADNMRAPMRGRYNDAPGGPSRNRYPDERAGSVRGRYMPRNPGGFRPQGREYGARAPRGRYNDSGSYRNRPQSHRRPYADRDSHGFDDYNSGSFQGHPAAGDHPPPPGRFKNRDSYHGDGYHEPQSANSRGSWDDSSNLNNDGIQLNTPRESRSRSASPERNHGTWHRSPTPGHENPIDDAMEGNAIENPTDGGIGFNEDVLFEAP